MTEPTLYKQSFTEARKGVLSVTISNASLEGLVMGEAFGSTDVMEKATKNLKENAAKMKAQYVFGITCEISPASNDQHKIIIYGDAYKSAGTTQ